jgi:predicted negative regulator of RcsB-dependent stress response
MLARNPANDLARFSLAKALFDAGRHSEAAESLHACIAMKPDWMFPTILLARCQLQLGDKRGALASLEQARTLAIEQHHDGPLEEINELLASL